MTMIGGTSSTAQYAYDANGNQLTRTEVGVTETNGYDVFNRLTSAVKDGVTATYSYKPDGLRFSKTVDGVKTTHIWDGSYIALDLDGSNAVVDSYIRGINLIKSSNNGYYLYNAHGDVTKLADSTGTVTKSYEYDAFGVEQEQDENDANPFRYCGEYFDIEIGTVYLRARYYSPLTARFLTEDSFRGSHKDPLSLNLYTYTHNNPIRYTDPNGHSIIDTIIKGIVISGVVIGAAVSGSIGAGGKGTSGSTLNYKSSSVTKSAPKVDNYTYNAQLTFTDFIYDQKLGNASKLKIGVFTGSYNGCGPSAAFNALRVLGTNVHPANIIKYLEDNNGVYVEGLLGTSDRVIRKYIEDSFAYDVLLTYYRPPSLDRAIEDSAVSILRYSYTTALFGGQHYITVQYTGTENYSEYRVYNELRYANKTNYEVYHSIDALMTERNLGFQSLIRIKK